MTTTLTPSLTPRRQSVPAMVIGIIVTISGVLTVLSGAVILALFGSGNAQDAGPHPVTTPTSALVTDLGHIRDINGFDFLTGSPTLHLAATTVAPAGAFVGVGPTRDVERYLDGVAVDRVVDFELSPYRMDVERRDGSAVAGAPREQTFWVASAASVTDAELSWKLADGNYQMVVMNADGSPGVAGDATIGVSLPDSSGIWTIVLAVGLLITAGGVVLIVVGARRVSA